MKTFIRILFISFLIFPVIPIFPQWQIGASFNFKNEIPEKGIGVNINRNLPFQRAAFGVKLRAGIDLFRQSGTETIDGRNVERSFKSEDYHIEIIGSFFFRNFSPYFGFGFGYSRININELNEGSLLFSLLAGLSIPINNFINPYIEIQAFNYFSDFDPALSGRDISSFQLRGAAGISFSINTLSN
jgi:hypothetical protein